MTVKFRLLIVYLQPATKHPLSSYLPYLPYLPYPQISGETLSQLTLMEVNMA